MDLVHERGSMDLVHESGPWTWSKVGVHGPLVHVLSSPAERNTPHVLFGNCLIGTVNTPTGDTRSCYNY